MNRMSLIGVSVALALAASTSAFAGEAASGTELWKSKGCLNCHDKDTKKVGPAFKDVAAKKPSKAALEAKLKEGKGHMKVNASDAELSAMIDAVLAAK